jgi:hypothetical protein
MKRTIGIARQLAVSHVWSLIACSLLIFAASAGAAQGGDENRIPPVGTWMVDLTPQSTSDTINATIAALPRDLTVLALQGVHLDEDDLAAFTLALSPDYPVSYYVSPATPHDIGCAPVLPVEVCESVLGLTITDCATRIAQDMLGCMVDYSMPLVESSLEDVFQSFCGGSAGLLLVIDQQCPACLLNTGKENGGNSQAAYSTCVAQQGPRYAYGGSVGQLILSKHPINDVEVVDFPSYEHRRANVYATINDLRYGFASYPKDILLDAGLAAFVPALPGDLQPVLAQEMLESDADVLLGNFSSGTQYQSGAYQNLLTGFEDLAPGVITHCTQAMIDAMDPNCFHQTYGGPVFLNSTDVDHVFAGNGSEGCFWLGTPKLFAEASGLSRHVGLRVCNSDLVFVHGFEDP